MSDDSDAGPPAERPEPPYQAIAPNLDRFTRESLRSNSVSRRRIVRAAVVGVVLLVGSMGAIAWTIAFGR
jgi:hypothetical protein